MEERKKERRSRHPENVSWNRCCVLLPCPDASFRCPDAPGKMCFLMGLAAPGAPGTVFLMGCFVSLPRRFRKMFYLMGLAAPALPEQVFGWVSLPGCSFSLPRRSRQNVFLMGLAAPGAPGKCFLKENKGFF